jgi:RNA polymerase sigma-70 factor, ECF subfamily
MTSAANGLDEMDTGESHLIRQILRGRHDLFADLIAPHLAPLLRIVRASIGNHPDVEDIVQTTALKALTHLEQFRYESSFKTWLIQIGVNEARQWQRKSAASRLSLLEPLLLAQLPFVDEGHSSLVECQRIEAIARLRIALGRLPEKDRVVILLRDLEELSLADAAVRLGLTLTATKSRHYRARRKIAKLIIGLNQSHPRSRSCR